MKLHSMASMKLNAFLCLFMWYIGVNHVFASLDYFDCAPMEPARLSDSFECDKIVRFLGKRGGVKISASIQDTLREDQNQWRNPKIVCESMVGLPCQWQERDENNAIAKCIGSVPFSELHGWTTLYHQSQSPEHNTILSDACHRLSLRTPRQCFWYSGQQTGKSLCQPSLKPRILTLFTNRQAFINQLPRTDPGAVYDALECQNRDGNVRYISPHDDMVAKLISNHAEGAGSSPLPPIHHNPLNPVARAPPGEITGTLTACSPTTTGEVDQRVPVDDTDPLKVRHLSGMMTGYLKCPLSRVSPNHLVGAAHCFVNELIKATKLGSVDDLPAAQQEYGNYGILAARWDQNPYDEEESVFKYSEPSQSWSRLEWFGFEEICISVGWMTGEHDPLLSMSKADVAVVKIRGTSFHDYLSFGFNTDAYFGFPGTRLYSVLPLEKTEGMKYGNVGRWGEAGRQTWQTSYSVTPVSFANAHNAKQLAFYGANGNDYLEDPHLINPDGRVLQDLTRKGEQGESGSACLGKHNGKDIIYAVVSQGCRFKGGTETCQALEEIGIRFRRINKNVFFVMLRYMELEEIYLKHRTIHTLTHPPVPHDWKMNIDLLFALAVERGETNGNFEKFLKELAALDIPQPLQDEFNIRGHYGQLISIYDDIRKQMTQSDEYFVLGMAITTFVESLDDSSKRILYLTHWWQICDSNTRSIGSVRAKRMIELMIERYLNDAQPSASAMHANTKHMRSRVTGAQTSASASASASATAKLKAKTEYINAYKFEDMYDYNYDGNIYDEYSYRNALKEQFVFDSIKSLQFAQDRNTFMIVLVICMVCLTALAYTTCCSLGGLWWFSSVHKYKTVKDTNSNDIEQSA
eukprot:25015_1